MGTGFVLAVLALALLLAFAGRGGLWLVLLTVAAAVVLVAGGFWFLLQRGCCAGWRLSWRSAHRWPSS